MKHVLAVILTSLFIQGILLSVAPAVAFAQETQVTSFVSGAVYLDVNGNGMAEPNEQNLGGATANARAVDGTIFTATTNQYGFYLIGDLPQGDYVVWAVDSVGNITAEIPVSLGEVNAAVALDLGVIDNSNDVEFVELVELVEATTMRNVMFLPLVNR